MLTGQRFHILSLLATVVAVQLLTLALGKGFYLTQLTMTAYYSLIIIGLCLLMGYAGQISLGHAGFFAIGGYTSAVLTTMDLSTYKSAALVGVLTKLSVLTARQDLYGGHALSLHPWAACIAAVLLTVVMAYAIGIPVLDAELAYR